MYKKRKNFFNYRKFAHVVQDSKFLLKDQI